MTIRKHVDNFGILEIDHFHEEHYSNDAIHRILSVSQHNFIFLCQNMRCFHIAVDLTINKQETEWYKIVSNFLGSLEFIPH